MTLRPPTRSLRPKGSSCLNRPTTRLRTKRSSPAITPRAAGRLRSSLSPTSAARNSVLPSAAAKRKSKGVRTSKPIPRTIPFPNRLDERSYITKGSRVRLFGADYEALRFAAYQRARSSGNSLMTALCECGCGQLAPWGDHLGVAARGEVAHNEHGSRKSDELSRVKWMRHECHEKSHNAGGKPVPAKPRGEA